MADRRYKVVVAGRDISPLLEPILTRLSLHDEVGAQSDTAQIELDDRNGEIILPRTRAPVEITLTDLEGRAAAFLGFVDELHSRGDRGGGRTLSISAKGLDSMGPLKEARERHWDDAKLGDVLKAAGQAAGLSEVVVDAQLGAITRPYFAQNGESFLAFGERLAREVGGTFRVQGGRGMLVRRGAGLTAGGKAVPTIEAEWGKNLIGWDITPEQGRPRHRRTRVRLYDPKTGGWKERTAEVSDASAEARFTATFPGPDEADAGRQAAADAVEVGRAKGAGEVTIDGHCGALPEGVLRLKGARPGIDGDYRIQSVEHAFDRSGGLVTRLELGEPQGEAGRDPRRLAAAS